MGKFENREWHTVEAIPAEITGQRRELLEMMLAATPRHSAQWSGKSPRMWRFTFPDSGGWSTVHDIRQDKVEPLAVAQILSGEAFGEQVLQDEIMGVLRRINGVFRHHPAPLSAERNEAAQ